MLEFQKLDVDTGPPIIYLNGAVLASSIAEGNQWFRNNSEIQGAQAQFYNLSEIGIYQTQVHQQGCFVGPSNLIYYGVSYTTDQGLPQYGVFPNPATELITIESSQPFQYISIVGITGTIVNHRDFGNSNSYVEMDISEIPPGVYIVLVTTALHNTVFRTKLMKL